MKYSGWTSYGTAGAPIISVENQKLIAIHEGSKIRDNFTKLGVGLPMYSIISIINEELEKKDKQNPLKVNNEYI